MNPAGSDSATPGLRDALHAWCETLEALRLTLTEDRPAPGHSALGDGLADATDDVIGWLEEAAASCASAEGARESTRLVARALRVQGDKLFGSAHQVLLDRLARTGGAAWHAWVTAVRCSAEPLWARAEDVVRLLSASACSAPPEPLTHTSYYVTHLQKSETFNPSI